MFHCNAAEAVGEFAIVPFGTCTWNSGALTLGRAPPKPRLSQEEPNLFLLLESFYYRVPTSDPDNGRVYVVAGADAPSQLDPREWEQNGETFVVPPNAGGRTDLASVPWIASWLVASYGSHTLAVLLHDSLVPDDGEEEMVARTAADRLLLTALREPGQKKGAFRHWLMWAAVSVYGTMRRPLFLRPFFFSLQALAIWGLLITGLVWVWGTGIDPWQWYSKALVAAGGLILFEVLLGMFWRAGLGFRPGAVLVPVLLGAVALVALVDEWRGPGTTRAFWVLLVAAVLLPLGFLWGAAVDGRLRAWLWPTSLVGLPVVVIPGVVIVFSAFLAWVIDLGASAVAAARDPGRTFQTPAVRPYRWDQVDEGDPQQ